MSHADSKSQPAPSGDGNPVTIEVVTDLLNRRQQGIKKYGVELKTGNGRDALVDAYQEALDLVMYLKQRLLEQDALQINAKLSFTDRELEVLTVSINSWYGALWNRMLDNKSVLSVPTDQGELSALFNKLQKIRQS
jgi:hypothetical protein